MALVSAAMNVTIQRATGETDNLGQQGSSTLTNVFIETVDLDMGDPRLKKMVQRILLHLTSIQAVDNLKLTVKYRNDLADVLTTAATYDLVAVGQPLKVRLPAARFIRLRLHDEGVVVNWALFGFELWGVVAGARW